MYYYYNYSIFSIVTITVQLSVTCNPTGRTDDPSRRVLHNNPESYEKTGIIIVCFKRS